MTDAAGLGAILGPVVSSEDLSMPSFAVGQRVVVGYFGRYRTGEVVKVGRSRPTVKVVMKSGRAWVKVFPAKRVLTTAEYDELRRNCVTELGACSFCLGFRSVEDGTIYTEPSALEVLQAWPAFSSGNITSFQEGARDALNGDVFRMGLHLGGPKREGWRCPLAVGVA